MKLKNSGCLSVNPVRRSGVFEKIYYHGQKDKYNEPRGRNVGNLLGLFKWFGNVVVKQNVRSGDSRNSQIDHKKRTAVNLNKQYVCLCPE